MLVRGVGPSPAEVMIVGEAPGREEEVAGRPFVGASGHELTLMLREAGIAREACFITNVVRQRPPDNEIEAFIPVRKSDIEPSFVKVREKFVHQVVARGFVELEAEIRAVKPRTIIALGNTALWALTGRSGITSWRGSELVGAPPFPAVRVIPTYHPAAILRQWPWRPVAVHDLKKARLPPPAEPCYSFVIRPSWEAVSEFLFELEQGLQQPTVLSVDLETRARHIACIGIATSATRAVCIPLMCRERPDGYWSANQEAEIVWRLQNILTHPNCRVVGQNFLYDTQYIHRYWKFIPNLWWDTMIAHHCAFPNMPKGLDFLSSLYCDHHLYWKDEGKELDDSVPEDQLWTYNCKDAVKTFEICEIEQRALREMRLEPQHDFQRALWWACLEAMIRGVAIDNARRPELTMELARQMEKLEEFFQFVLGHPLNPRSTKQMHTLFYEDLRVPKVLNRKTGNPSLDDESLDRVATREPLLRPLISAISDYRTLGVFKSTFLEAQLDIDGKMRSSLNPAGTVTFRLSSSQNAFGSGMNMENIPSEKSKSLGKAEQRARAAGLNLELPNIRELFIPDAGHIVFDADLDRADLQVVVWEADDEELRAALRLGVDIHLLNAGSLFSLPITLEALKDLEKAAWLKERYKHQREFSKVFVHGTNYGGSARTMAAHVKTTVIEAERAQARWFHAHPGIRLWHDRTMKSLVESRSVSNRFGFRIRFLDRIEGLLPEALAWVPQSTVAHVINQGWINILRKLPEVQVLIQVHDSLVGQFPLNRKAELVPAIREAMLIEIPYEDPLVIPVGIGTSERSWGTCGKDL